MTRKDILDIFYDIVQYSKRLDCGGLNSYVYITDGEVDFKSPTGGKTYNDYLQKEFWSRNWVESGADQNTMKIQAGVLFVESKTSSMPNIQSKGVCHEFFITFADQLECKTCDNECTRTRSQADNDTLSMLNAIIQELVFKYRLYTIDGVEKWTTAAYIADYTVKFPTAVIVDKNIELSDYIRSEKLDFNNWGEKSQYIGFSTKIVFCGCSDNILQKDFFKPEISEIGQVVCSTC